jgi:hypothetical protein
MVGSSLPTKSQSKHVGHCETTKHGAGTYQRGARRARPGPGRCLCAGSPGCRRRGQSCCSARPRGCPRCTCWARRWGRARRVRRSGRRRSRRLYRHYTGEYSTRRTSTAAKKARCSICSSSCHQSSCNDNNEARAALTKTKLTRNAAIEGGLVVRRVDDRVRGAFCEHALLATLRQQVLGLGLVPLYRATPGHRVQADHLGQPVNNKMFISQLWWQGGDNTPANQAPQPLHGCYGQ